MTQQHHDKGKHVPEKPVHEPEKQLATGATITNTNDADLPRGASRAWVTVVAIIVVVLVVIGLLLMAFVLPNLSAANIDAKKLADKNNLKGLFDAYVMGQSASMAAPKSTGFRFWVALYTGDGPSEGKPEGETNSKIFLTPDQAALLVCPTDSVPDITALPNKLSEALKSGKGAHAADSSWCSYAGPKDPANDLRAKNATVVGATGSRDGRSFFSDGFSVVRSNGSVEFLSYAAMTLDYGWPEKPKEPVWVTDLLSHVKNIE